MYHLCSQGSKIQPSCISDTWSGETQTKEVCENIREARRCHRYWKQKQTWGWDWHRTKLRFSHSNTKVKWWTNTWQIRCFSLNINTKGQILKAWEGHPWHLEKRILWWRQSSRSQNQNQAAVSSIFSSEPEEFLFKFNQLINQSGPPARLSEV